jgi:hypothetical protein
LKNTKCGGALGIHLDLGPCHVLRKGTNVIGALVL